MGIAIWLTMGMRIKKLRKRFLNVYIERVFNHPTMGQQTEFQSPGHVPHPPTNTTLAVIS